MDKAGGGTTPEPNAVRAHRQDMLQDSRSYGLGQATSTLPHTWTDSTW